MSRPRWNERDAAQALLASYRSDYSLPGDALHCRECHCEDCLPEVAKRPCCTLARLLLDAEKIVKRRSGAKRGRNR